MTYMADILFKYYITKFVLSLHTRLAQYTK